MRKQLCFSFLLFILLSFSTCFHALAASNIEVLASISMVDGDVQVKKSGSATWDKADKTIFLKTGDQVKTGAKSSCVIKWNQGNFLKLTSFTNFKFDKVEKNLSDGSETSSINVWTGRLTARAKKLDGANSTFEVKTPTAIAAVRGTCFSVGVDAEESTSVLVTDGKVNVKSVAGGDVTLSKNQKTTVKKGESPAEPIQTDSKDDEVISDMEDLSAATLEIMQPVGDLETDTSPILIKGMTDPGVQVSVNGQAVQADQNGMFTVSVSLEEGVNHIKIDAPNKKGKITTKTRVIKYSAKEAEPAPTSLNLNVSSPSDGVITKDSSITVTGSVDKSAEISINTSKVSVTDSGQFSFTANLSEGENKIAVTAKIGSLTETITRKVIRDTTPPMLIVTMPAANFDINTGACSLFGDEIQCTVVGQTEPGASLTINDERYSVDSDGSFTHSITLDYSSGISINIAVSDSIGNRTSQILTRTVRRDAVAYLDMTVSPTSIYADGEDIATITITTTNLLHEPVSAAVNLSASTGGKLAQSNLTTTNGMASTSFKGNSSSGTVLVTITATSGGITATKTFTLKADVPAPPPGK